MILILTFSSQSEKDKFEQIYNKYKRLMLYKAYGILKDSMLAEDAVSEAFIRIYKNLEKIEDTEAKQTVAFVMTIVRNTAINLLNKQKKNVMLDFDAQQEDSFDLEQHVLGKITAEQVTILVERLGDEMRDVFILKYAYDLPHKEIAGLLSITENHVTVRLHRARKRMAKLLVEGGYIDERE